MMHEIRSFNLKLVDALQIDSSIPSPGDNQSISDEIWRAIIVMCSGCGSCTSRLYMGKRDGSDSRVVSMIVEELTDIFFTKFLPDCQEAFREKVIRDVMHS